MAKTKKVLQYTSAGTGLLPFVDIGFISEDTLLSRKGSSRNDYFAGREKYLATLFKTTTRASSNDTRPDLELDPDILERVIRDGSGRLALEKLYGRANDQVTQGLDSLLSSLRNFKESSYYAELGENFYGGEVKGSKAGVDVYEKKIQGKKVNLVINPEQDFDEYGRVKRTSARTLSGRTLLGAYDRSPDSNSKVISLANALANTLGYLKDFRPDLAKKQQKNIENLIKIGSQVDLGKFAEKLEASIRSQEKIDELRITNSIFTYLKTGTNLTKFHKTVTGEPPTGDKDIWIKLYNTPAVKQVRAKGEQLFMQYVKGTNNGSKIIRTSYTAYLKGSFKYENTKVILRPNEIEFAYTNAYEKAVIAKIQERLQQAADKAFTNNMIPLFKDTDLASRLGTLQDLIALKNQREAIIDQIVLDTSGSIPIGKIKIPNYTVKRKTSGSAFQSRIGSIRSLLQETRVKTPSMGDFVTDDTITALTKREMLRRMPIGPIGGPPKSSRVLTYRTGRFVNSVQVIADMKSKAMQYYYDPNYWIHEATSRNPRNLIDSSINSVTRSLFGRRFNLVKANQSL